MRSDRIASSWRHVETKWKRLLASRSIFKIVLTRSRPTLEDNDCLFRKLNDTLELTWGRNIGFTDFKACHSDSRCHQMFASLLSIRKSRIICRFYSAILWLFHCMQTELEKLMLSNFCFHSSASVAILIDVLFSILITVWYFWSGSFFHSGLPEISIIIVTETNHRKQVESGSSSFVFRLITLPDAFKLCL